MKAFRLKSLTAVLGALALSVAAAAAPQVGEPAPGFTGVDSNGTSHALSDFSDKTVILEWTNHGCPYVQKHYNTGNMQAMQKKTTKDGIVWLTIISSAPGKQGHVSPEEANELTQSREAAPTAVILDPEGDIGRAYDAKTTPHMYIIEKGVLKYMGAIDDKPDTKKESVETATNHVKVALAEIKSGKPVSTPVTKAYGCTVKY